MANSVEDIYQQIAGYIVESIDDDWSVAWVCAEMEEDDNGLTYDRYRTADSDGDLSFKAGHEVYELFDALRRMLKRPSEKPWRFAKFTPEPSGKFHIDFEYEPPFTLSANLDQSEAGRVSNDRGLETTQGRLRSLPCPVMVGERVAPLTATTEPDVRLSPHPALEHQGLCHRHYQRRLLTTFAW